ncbi:DJ-1/PfpI family protein [Pseudomonas typographi]|uniref:DJ-1/PfpI family protein n=1 Tax=Pseudomonas typographi TaxID=2715964 RepID=A0ABR7Z859_9PSED|nr:DJ-1/PfpI family protein [Pseudomonas typographi]MBD1601711.1 DJ-1/PfpI family protein [Pseudomonas typographi]
MNVGFLLFPGIQPLDLIGPFDVLAGLPEVSLCLLAPELEPVQASRGLWLRPDTLFGACPALDVLCVPGGAGIEAVMADDRYLEFIRAQAPGLRYLSSVCTGALALGAAGLLRGRRVTTHWAYQHLLVAFGAVAVEQRVVRDAELITGGGVTAGIDFALVLVAELFGTERAQRLQLALEYAPAPPFASGHPAEAPPAIVQLQRAAVQGAVDQRAAAVARAAARVGQRAQPC